MKQVSGVWISNIPAFEDLVQDFVQHFKCQRCGKCCTMALQGTIISHDDIRRLAPFLDMSNTAFERQYVQLVDTLRGKKQALKQPCVFYEDGKGCTVYNFRPKACRVFPVWTVQYQSYGRIAVHVLCPAAHDQLQNFEGSLTL